MATKIGDEIAMGQTILILPLGLAPLIFFIVWIVFIKGSDTNEKYIAPKIRKGKTEYPVEVTGLWNVGSVEKVEFTNDGKSIAVTVNPLASSTLTTNEDIKQWIITSLNEYRSHNSEKVVHDWVNHCIIEGTTEDSKTGSLIITLTVDDQLIKNHDYLWHEIKNVGRVHMANTTTNGSRYLSHRTPKNELHRENGRILVTIERTQSTQGVFDSWKEVIMSERQITRNIENRLWNRYQVKCISMDDDSYYGEIIGA